MDDGHTISLPACEKHPPLREWPIKNLIESSCPRCTHAYDPDKTARELKARRLIATRGER